MGDTLVLERPRQGVESFAYGSSNPAPPELDTSLPRAVRVQDLDIERAAQEAFARGLGSLAVGETVQEDGVESILDDMEKAAAGNPEAMERNALSALYEGIICQGVSEVEIERDEQYRLSQSGRSIYDVLRSSIEHHPGDHPILHEITMLEAKGLYSWDALDAAGYFDDHVLVVPRLVPAGVPAKSMRKYGYFENLAIAWGIVWKTGAGKFKMRSLFTAGATVEDHEESATGEMTDNQLNDMFTARLGRRHDMLAVAKMYEHWGLPVPEDPKDYHRGALINKSWFKHPNDPNADIAELYDNQLGSGYFLGDKGSRQDYVAHGRKCLDTLQRLKPLAKELARDHVQTHYGKVSQPMVAARLLAKMGRERIIDYVIDHPEVDARPLGLAVVREREIYHQMIASGNYTAAMDWRKSIQQKARVNMCGFGGKGIGSESNNDANDPLDNSSRRPEDQLDSEEGASGKKKMNCPFCRAKVYDDPCARVLKCGDCKAKVVDGVVVYEGDGGSKARAARRTELMKQIDEAFAGVDVESFEAKQNTTQNTQAATGKLAVASSSG